MQNRLLLPTPSLINTYTKIHSYVWGYLSDKYGRRPILLIGVFGSMVSTSLFGISPSYGWAIAIRTFGGIMNSMKSIYYIYLLYLFIIFINYTYERPRVEILLCQCQEKQQLEPLKCCL